MSGHIRRLTTGRAKVAGNLLHVSSCQRQLSYTPRTYSRLNKLHNIAYLFYKLWSYFDHVMVMWEALPAYSPSRSGMGKPGNEAMCMLHSRLHIDKCFGMSVLKLCVWVTACAWKCGVAGTSTCVDKQGCFRMQRTAELHAWYVLLCTENALAKFCNKLHSSSGSWLLC